MTAPHAKLDASYRVFGRFLIGGGLNTLATFAFYWALLTVMHYQVAYAIAYLAGIVLSYWLNTKFVFKTGRSWQTFGLFPLVYATSYVLGAAMLHVATTLLGIDVRMAPLFSICVTLPFTYFLSKLILTGRA